MMIRILLVVATFLLGACSSSGWFGDEKNSTPIQGKRVSVLKEGGSLKQDSHLENVQVVLPSAVINDSWLHSQNGPGNAISHVSLSSEILDEIDSIDVGSGAKKGNILASTPVIAEGKIFVLDADMELAAYDREKPTNRLWKVELLEDVDDVTGGGFVYQNGVLYVATGHDIVVAINANDGSEKWRRTINGLVRAAPAVHGKVVVVVTIDNRTYALSREDGSILWTHAGITETTGIFGSAAPVIESQVAVIPHSSGEVYGLRYNDGDELWVDSLVFHRASAFTLADIDVPPVVAGGVVYATSQSGMLAADDLMSGDRLWEIELAGAGRPWVAGDFLYTITASAELVCVSVKDGGIKWISQLDHYKKPEEKEGLLHWSSPVLAGGRLFIVGAHGAMLEVSPKDGSVVHSYDIPSGVYLAPVVAQERLYLLTNNADLVVFGK